MPTNGWESDGLVQPDVSIGVLASAGLAASPAVRAARVPTSPSDRRLKMACGIGTHLSRCALAAELSPLGRPLALRRRLAPGLPFSVVWAGSGPGIGRTTTGLNARPPASTHDRC